MFTQLNFIAILVAAIAAFALAFVWYMPPVFGLRWASLTKRYTGLSDAELASNLPLKMGLWFAGFLVNALALALLVGLLGADNLTDGILLGVIVWFGSGVVISSWPVIHARQPVGIWLMNNGLSLLQQIAMASILTLWR
jgi:hypothetical protein